MTELNQESREKYWSELDDPNEKIERMRAVIKNLQFHVGKIREVADALIDHDHLNGRIVSPISRGDVYLPPSGPRISGKSEDTYF